MTNLQQVGITNDAGIYIIRNTINDNVYIGQSAYLYNRIRWHKIQLKKNSHLNQKLQRFVNKYGFDTLIFEVLEYLPRDKEVLYQREQFYMDQHKIKFNIATCAYSTLGVKKSKEEKIKMSLRLKGKKQSPEQIEAAAAPKRGKKRPPFSEQHRKRISEAAKKRKNNYWKGKHLSEETKKKLSEAHMGKKMPESFKEKMRLVTGGALNGMYGKKHSEKTKELIRQKKIERDSKNKAA